jgi:hypothetical protein
VTTKHDRRARATAVTMPEMPAQRMTPPLSSLEEFDRRHQFHVPSPVNEINAEVSSAVLMAIHIRDEEWIAALEAMAEASWFEKDWPLAREVVLREAARRLKPRR